MQSDVGWWHQHLFWALGDLANDELTFTNHKDTYDIIDATPHGDVLWQSFSVRYNGDWPRHVSPWMDEEVPPWMDAELDVWFCDPRTLVHNLLSNLDFNNEFNCTLLPWRETISLRTWCLVIGHGSRWYTILYYYALQLTDIFIQDIIAKDPETHGSMFILIILGSDKTTVSVVNISTQLTKSMWMIQ